MWYNLPVEIRCEIICIAAVLAGPEHLESYSPSRDDPCRTSGKDISKLNLISSEWANLLRPWRFSVILYLRTEEGANRFWEWARHPTIGVLECATLIRHLKIDCLPSIGGFEEEDREETDDTEGEEEDERDSERDSERGENTEEEEAEEEEKEAEVDIEEQIVCITTDDCSPSLSNSLSSLLSSPQ